MILLLRNASTCKANHMYQFVILDSMLSIAVKFNISRLNKANFDPLLVCILQFILTLNIIITICTVHVIHMVFISVLQAKVALIIICIFRWFGYCYGLSASPRCMYIFFWHCISFIKTILPFQYFLISVRQVMLGHSDQMLLSFR